MSDDSLQEAQEVLRRVFGHAGFRGLQAPVIAEVMAGRPALAVLPTGGGKSVCYQIPALLRPGLGLVVSPLIALMADQVAGLIQAGVAAARLDSLTTPEDRAATWARIEAGTLDLLYVSPEGLLQPWMLERLSRIPLSVIAIDEAHCVSQWGHDFRPEYRLLGRLAEVFPGVPRLAVTATADARTRQDIREGLHLGEAREFVASFDRPELALSAERKVGTGRKRVLELASARRDRPGVIYAGSRDGTEALAAELCAAGLPAMAYHAGLDRDLRERRLTEFLASDAAVMVATIAFGMGVDKPDVRYVIHADPPASIEAYWQEVGRAGRDGEPAEGITLYGAPDMAWALRRLDGQALSDEVRAVQVRKVRQLYALLDGGTCRTAAVRRYFGEQAVADCGRCDNCLDPPKAEDLTLQAQKVLSAAHRLNGRFGRGRLVEHLLGKTREPSAFEAGLSTFGVGAELPAGAWRGLVDQLIFDGLLREDPNEGRPLIGLGDADAVRAVYRGERRVEGRLVQRHPGAGADASTSPGRRRRDGPGAEFEGDPQIFAALRAWRRAEAMRQKAPPYVIFSDRTLAEIATARPADAAALSRVSGVGETKLARYGPAVLALVAGQTPPGDGNS